MTDLFRNIEGFDWDNGNSGKSLEKHYVTQKESEEVFVNAPLIVFEDEKHSSRETRYLGLGKTDAGKLLSNSFTFRRNMIRIISSRRMSRKERRMYEKEA